MKYINPYTISCNVFRHTSENPIKKPFSKCVLSYRGVDIYHYSHRCWDYVHDNICIKQLAGFDKDRSKRIIDDYLDHTTNETNSKYHSYERSEQAYKAGLTHLKANPDALT